MSNDNIMAQLPPVPLPTMASEMAARREEATHMAQQVAAFVTGHGQFKHRIDGMRRSHEAFHTTYRSARSDAETRDSAKLAMLTLQGQVIGLCEMAAAVTGLPCHTRSGLLPHPIVLEAAQMVMPTIPFQP